MTNTEINDFIKLLIKSKADNSGNHSAAFIDEIKEDVLSTIKNINPKVAEKDNQTLDRLYQTARNEYLSVNPVYINPASSLTDDKLKVWLTEERKKAIPPDYINRYFSYLRKNGRSEKVIDEISKSSEKILGSLGDPQSNTGFYIKGLVVGSVQSGKTGNFNAVINRSIDAGYSLIIVLSGIMEDLRSQTQERIEKDVIGEGVINKETNQKGAVGVGNESRFGELGKKSVPQVFSITSYKSDFSRSIKEADFSLNNKNILICKKNTGVLKNLLIWLHEHLNEKTKHNIPLLIIDDEADNASLNNLGHKGREYASTINGHIRAILGLFTKKTYLGYTATPFANVLQDRNEQAEGKWLIDFKQNGIIVKLEFEQVENIFPDDFIVLLNSPSNYIGAKQIFQTIIDTDIPKIPLVTAISDTNSNFPRSVVDTNEGVTLPSTSFEHDADVRTRAAKKSDKFPQELPDSLKEATKCFILSIAVRLSRKLEMINSALYNPHHTMLVHISRFITWQTKTKELIQEYIKELKARIDNDSLNSTDSVYYELEKTWNKHYNNIVANIRTYLPDDYSDEFLTAKTFEQIKSGLTEAIEGIDVKAINSETKDKLVYTADASKNGKKYIAIGGNRLSRGFTLEGLTINYFIRDTNFSDTLLQMGRWFGYRPGYLDVCKLFTTSDSIDKFDMTTRTIEELEMEFKKMERKGKTPKEFVIRVKKHPGTLKITRPSILKNTEEVNWSYQDKLEQTTSFELNANKIKSAWEALKNLFTEIGNKFIIDDENGFFKLNTDHNGLFKFLGIPNTFHSYSNDIENIKSFISLCVRKRKLQNWVIAVKKKGAGRILQSSESGLPDAISLTIRSGPDKNPIYREKFFLEKVFTASGKSANIVSGSDFSILLSDSEKAEVQKKFREERTEYYIKERGFSKERATEEARKLAFPERIYREKIPDTTGLMIIYILDSKHVFGQSEDADINIRMNDFIQKENINTEIPIFGYAIGFPKIEPDPGGEYVKGKYAISDDQEDEVEEVDEELLKQED